MKYMINNVDYRKSVVLMWNPSISSVKQSDFDLWFDGMCTFKESLFNWSVYDHENVGYGDRFLLIRVGDDHAGLVAAGLIASDCYEGRDWAGTDKKRYYADLVPMIAFNTSNGAYYPTAADLEDVVADFDWRGGHSGRVLSKEQSRKIEEYLDNFDEWLEKNSNDVNKVRTRDYVVSPQHIHPQEDEVALYPREDSTQFIEMMIEQATGCPARDLETKWEEHSHMWVRQHESLLRAAAWMAFPIKDQLPYYGALCLKIAYCYLGEGNVALNAAYAKEAADYLSSPALRHDALMTWLSKSLKNHVEWGTNHAVDPLIRSKIRGLELLSDFLGYDPCQEENMLHDYYVRKVVASLEDDFIDISVSRDPDGSEEDILVFHIVGNTEIDMNYDIEDCLYIYEVEIGPWRGDRLQVAVDGLGIRARGERLEFSILPAAK